MYPVFFSSGMKTTQSFVLLLLLAGAVLFSTGIYVPYSYDKLRYPPPFNSKHSVATSLVSTCGLLGISKPLISDPRVSGTYELAASSILQQHIAPQTILEPGEKRGYTAPYNQDTVTTDSGLGDFSECNVQSAFDNDAQSFVTCKPNAYSKSGHYQAWPPTSTMLTTGQRVNGEWLQVKLPSAVGLVSYQLLGPGTDPRANTKSKLGASASGADPNTRGDSDSGSPRVTADDDDGTLIRDIANAKIKETSHRTDALANAATYTSAVPHRRISISSDSDSEATTSTAASVISNILRDREMASVRGASSVSSFTQFLDDDGTENEPEETAETDAHARRLAALSDDELTRTLALSDPSFDADASTVKALLSDPSSSTSDLPPTQYSEEVSEQALTPLLRELSRLDAIPDDAPRGSGAGSVSGLDPSLDAELGHIDSLEGYVDELSDSSTNTLLPERSTKSGTGTATGTATKIKPKTNIDANAAASPNARRPVEWYLLGLPVATRLSTYTWDVLSYQNLTEGVDYYDTLDLLQASGVGEFLIDSAAQVDTPAYSVYRLVVVRVEGIRAGSADGDGDASQTVAAGNHSSRGASIDANVNANYRGQVSIATLNLHGYPAVNPVYRKAAPIPSAFSHTGRALSDNPHYNPQAVSPHEDFAAQIQPRLASPSDLVLALPNKHNGHFFVPDSPGAGASTSMYTGIVSRTDDVVAQQYFMGKGMIFGRSLGLPNSGGAKQPTPEPTSRPTSIPTSRPTMVPTGQPTSQPTNEPSAQPSGQPTRQPSTQPSGQPTGQPSGQPSVQPTAQPSGQPTTQPTGQPSGQPSVQPTGQPSKQPTGQPTGQPSGQPTGQPSGQPSNQPTGQPSAQPSGQPTKQPTWQPSSQPSRQPSAQPTGQPSSQPTGQPSGQPSAQPTWQPSSQPTAQPSGEPTAQPSMQPSGQPSGVPTGQPSGQPTSRPTGQPSGQPSWAPTMQPTSVPSVQPTEQPTRQPSAQPTSQPTAQPSYQPSGQPTAQPSSQPSSLPSLQPTAQPTYQPTFIPTFPPTSSAPSETPTIKPRHIIANSNSAAVKVSIIIYGGIVVAVLICAGCLGFFFFTGAFDAKKKMKKQGKIAPEESKEGDVEMAGRGSGDEDRHTDTHNDDDSTSDSESDRHSEAPSSINTSPDAEFSRDVVRLSYTHSNVEMEMDMGDVLDVGGGSLMLSVDNPMLAEIRADANRHQKGERPAERGRDSGGSTSSSASSESRNSSSSGSGSGSGSDSEGEEEGREEAKNGPGGIDGPAARGGYQPPVPPSPPRFQPNHRHLGSSTPMSGNNTNTSTFTSNPLLQLRAVPNKRMSMLPQWHYHRDASSGMPLPFREGGAVEGKARDDDDDSSPDSSPGSIQYDPSRGSASDFESIYANTKTSAIRAPSSSPGTFSSGVNPLGGPPPGPGPSPSAGGGGTSLLSRLFGRKSSTDAGQNKPPLPSVISAPTPAPALAPISQSTIALSVAEARLRLANADTTPRLRGRPHEKVDEDDEEDEDEEEEEEEKSVETPGQAGRAKGTNESESESEEEEEEEGDGKSGR